MQTAEETDAVVNACEAAGVQYMDASMWIHSPRTRAIKEILQRHSTIGQLKSVIASFNIPGDFSMPLMLIGCCNASMQLLLEKCAPESRKLSQYLQQYSCQPMLTLTYVT